MHPLRANVFAHAAASILFVIVLSVTAQAPLAAQPPARAPGAQERLLFRLEDDFAHAVVKRDADALRKLVAPRWVYSDESGVMEREAGIAAFTSGTDTVLTASNSRMRALVYGNTAVVIGVLNMSGRGPGGAFSRRYRYTDTWMRIDDRWQCIASQDYLMPAGK